MVGLAGDLLSGELLGEQALRLVVHDLHRAALSRAPAFLSDVAAGARGVRAAAQRSHRRDHDPRIRRRSDAARRCSGCRRWSACCCGRSCSCCSTICAGDCASAIRSRSAIVASLLKPLKDTRHEAFAFRGRAIAGFLIIAAALIGLGVRFAYLEIARHDEFALRSDSNRIVDASARAGPRPDLRPQRHAARRQRRRVPARSDARAGQGHGRDARAACAKSCR